MLQMEMPSTVSVLGFTMTLLLLTGCSKPQEIEISTSPIDKPELVLPQAQELNLRTLDWKVVTPENIDQVWEEIRSSGRPIVLFALTDEGYERVSLNLSDIRAYIQEQRAIIAAYDRYYKNVEQTLDEYNKNL